MLIHIPLFYDFGQVVLLLGGYLLNLVVHFCFSFLFYSALRIGNAVLVWKCFFGGDLWRVTLILLLCFRGYVLLGPTNASPWVDSGQIIPPA